MSIYYMLHNYALLFLLQSVNDMSCDMMFKFNQKLELFQEEKLNNILFFANYLK